VKIAIVLDARNQSTQSVRVGNNLAGDQSAWKLVELGPRKAVFEGPGGRTEAELRVFDGSGAQAPTALATPTTSPTSSSVAESGEQTDPGDGESVAVTTETPESRAELIRRRIEERRRQMREAAARSSEPKKE
jgi:general secretion pathway protein N